MLVEEDGDVKLLLVTPAKFKVEGFGMLFGEPAYTNSMHYIQIQIILTTFTSKTASYSEDIQCPRQKICNLC